jgi:two-component system sensor histidine kinase MtrB
MPGRRSLLTRVALAFAAAVALTAVILALAAYYLSKGAQDDRALNEALDQSRQNLSIADAMLPANPGPADYEALMPAFQIRGDFATLVETGAEVYRSGLDVTSDPISEELRAAVAQGNVRYQTVSVHGEPTIVVGSLLRAGELSIYFFFPQGERLAELSGLRNILVGAGALFAVLGAIAGYLLARRLLRPVREASKAAVQMSRGDLSIRLPAGPDEFGVLGASFNQMATSLESEMRDLEAGQARERRFVADVTHELRTPVAALVGEASLLKARLEAHASGCPPEVVRLAELVTLDIARLRQLVDDLLEISRLEAQAAESVPEPIEVHSFLARLIEAHGWSQVVRAQDQRPADRGFCPVVVADKRRLERILVNLIENALQHGAAPVDLECRPATSPLDGRPAVAIAVSDHGPGIPAEHLPHIFHRFYKADPSRSSSRGSGLGLAIARENARLLGGDITAANVPHGGARFVVSLPSATWQPWPITTFPTFPALTSTSWMELLRACPMWRMPVIFGGGITTQYD